MLCSCCYLCNALYYWATNHGYGFVNKGAGKGANHPVQTVDWYDCAKWCNARSQQAGRTPVYYTNAALTAVYTNGQPTTLYPNWAASGYRLPTEAEWEKAARGGLSGQRFPWGNVINQNLANYYGITSISYDLGPNGLNAIGSVGGTSPATSPVGSFAANGYGLNDMSGNVYAWCWDWYKTPYAGGSDPHGPAGPLSYRVLRGGSWDYYAGNARCAFRFIVAPSLAGAGLLGFRCVRGL
jgi:sulfatase modifying factor 1